MSLQSTIIDALTEPQPSNWSRRARAKFLRRLLKRVRAATIIEPTPRYKCPDCDTLLDEGERRCDLCNKFGSRVDVIGTCPHCGEAVEELE